MGVESGLNFLLDQVDETDAKQYYNALLHNLAEPAVEVRPDAGGNRGKGLFATKDFEPGEIVFSERPLVGIQEFHSKLATSTCANCFTAVGTVEQAFGGKICCLINELSDAPEGGDLKELQDKVDKVEAAVDSRRLEGLLSGQVQLPLTDHLQLCTDPVQCRNGCEDEYCSKACEQRAWQHHHCLLCPGPQQPPGSSGGGTHSAGGSSGSSRSGSSSSKGAGKARAEAALEVFHGARVNRAKLAKFLEHADDSNDIFRVAAQVIANTIITADTILRQAAADAEEHTEASAAFSLATSAAAAGSRASHFVMMASADGVEASSCCAADAGVGAGSTSPVTPPNVTLQAGTRPGCSQQVTHVVATAQSSLNTKQQYQQQSWSKAECKAALQAAFLPFALGHKAPWWQVAQAAETAAAAAQQAGGDSDSTSDGSDDDSMDPEELAAQMKELAADSLALLHAGLQDERFPELFDLQLYGSLVGMFELNNLALAVPGPVGRYKDMLTQPEAHGLSPAQAAAALHEVQPLLDAVGDAADLPAEVWNRLHSTMGDAQ